MSRAVDTGAVTLGEVLGIFKLRIAVTIMLSAVGGLMISPAPLPTVWQASFLAIAVFLASGAAGAFNQWAESDLDARMRRTASRPFASGKLHPGVAWLAIILVLLAFAVGLAAVSTNTWAALYTFLGAFTYGVVYTLWLKRRTWMNIVVGGLAGSFAVLAGAAAVDPSLSPEAILLAVVLFLWTPPHFWSLAMAVTEDYAANQVPMLPAVAGRELCAYVILGHTVLLSALALVPFWYGRGPVYLIAALAGGAWFTWTSIRLVREPTKRRAILNFLASLGQLVLLLAGTILDRFLMT
jgi:heme o synthase